MGREGKSGNGSPADGTLIWRRNRDLEMGILMIQGSEDTSEKGQRRHFPLRAYWEDDRTQGRQQRHPVPSEERRNALKTTSWRKMPLNVALLVWLLPGLHLVSHIGIKAPVTGQKAPSSHFLITVDCFHVEFLRWHIWSISNVNLDLIQESYVMYNIFNLNEVKI